ncbi:MAG: zinc ABC transporter substrate-binding protein, partial [Halalkalicoccus sp.]|nr:zinc ABC transporter substrate-binding protein [Halalkalicoccus sp.]
MDGTRRRFLQGGVGALAAASAGCLDSLGGGAPSVGGGGGGDAAATASFFTLADFSRNVAGDAISVENAVPMGQHGHGWEPQSDITVEIVEREAFVHLGIEGFQRWADDVAHEIEQNHDDVALIAAAEGVDLTEYGQRDEGGHNGHEHSHDGESGEEHGHDEEHGEGNYDPHFWVDPVRSQRAVETIRDGLVEVDDGNAEAYEANADAYLGEL